jgi:hypothetical protein
MISEKPTVGNLLVETIKSRDVSHWGSKTYISVLSIELEHLTSVGFFNRANLCGSRPSGLLDSTGSIQKQTTAADMPSWKPSAHQ